MSALDDLFGAGFESVTVARDGDGEGDFGWSASCIRRHDGGPGRQQARTGDGMGSVFRSDTHLYLMHYGPDRTDALAALAALAGVAESILAGATEGSATRGADG